MYVPCAENIFDVQSITYAGRYMYCTSNNSAVILRLFIDIIIYMPIQSTIPRHAPRASNSNDWHVCVCVGSVR